MVGQDIVTSLFYYHASQRYILYHLGFILKLTSGLLCYSAMRSTMRSLSDDMCTLK